MAGLLWQKTSGEKPLSTNELVKELADIGTSCGYRILNRILSKDVALLNEYGYEVKTKSVSHQNGYYMDSQNFAIIELKILINTAQGGGLYHK